MKRAMILFAWSLCWGTSTVHAQCKVANLLTNGDLTSAEGEAITAPGWTPSITPDVNDHNGPLNTTPGYSWSGIPLASANGGTWQNIYGPETFEQTVTLVLGSDYTLSFEYAAQGIMIDTAFYFIGPTSPLVYLNGAPAYTAPLDTTQYTWESASFTFTAPSAMVTIGFGESTGTMYLGIDGICLQLGSSLSVGNISETAALLAFPNPADAGFSVPHLGSDLADLTFRNILGEQVSLSAELSGDRIVIRTAHLPNGVYTLERSGNTGIGATRVVVDHR